MSKIEKLIWVLLISSILFIGNAIMLEVRVQKAHVQQCKELKIIPIKTMDGYACIKGVESNER